MGLQGRIGLQGVPAHGPHDHQDHERHHDAEDHPGVPHLLEHPPEHQHQGERKEAHIHHGEEVAPGAGVLEGMCRVGAEEAAAVGAQVLDGDDGRHGAATDLLGIRLAAVVVAHRSRFERGHVGRRLERHRHAVGQEDHAHDQAGRQEHVDDDAPHVDVEVAHVGVAAKPADDGREGTKAHARRDEHVPADEEDLAEVGKALLARIVLQIGIREEGSHRVEDRRRGHHRLVVRVERKATADWRARRSRK